MSGKKNKNPFGEEEENDIGYRNPAHVPKENDAVEEEKEADDDLDMKDEDGDDDEEDDEETESHGWHTFDMDNPDESL